MITISPFSEQEILKTIDYYIDYSVDWPDWPELEKQEFYRFVHILPCKIRMRFNFLRVFRGSRKAKFSF